MNLYKSTAVKFLIHLSIDEAEKMRRALVYIHKIRFFNQVREHLKPYMG